MASSSRYRFIESPGSNSTPLSVHVGSKVSNGGGSAGIRWRVGNSPLHILVRESLYAPGAKRSKSRAVADISERPSVGERLAAHPFLALLSRRRLPYLTRRERLGPVDDS